MGAPFAVFRRQGNCVIRMKLLLGLVLFGVCISRSLAVSIKDQWDIPEHYRRPAKILHNICLAESGAAEEKLRECMDGTLHDDHGAKCYINCLFDKIDVIDKATGQILLDRLAPLAPNDDMKNAFEYLTQQCGHIARDDPCDTAYEVSKCFFEAHDEVIKFCHLLMADIVS